MASSVAIQCRAQVESETYPATTALSFLGRFDIGRAQK
jgi:hypothetical protein